MHDILKLYIKKNKNYFEKLYENEILLPNNENTIIDFIGYPIVGMAVNIHIVLYCCFKHK